MAETTSGPDLVETLIVTPKIAETITLLMARRGEITPETEIEIRKNFSNLEDWKALREHLKIHIANLKISDPTALTAQDEQKITATLENLKPATPEVPTMPIDPEEAALISLICRIQIGAASAQIGIEEELTKTYDSLEKIQKALEKLNVLQSKSPFQSGIAILRSRLTNKAAEFPRVQIATAVQENPKTHIDEIFEQAHQNPGKFDDNIFALLKQADGQIIIYLKVKTQKDKIAGLKEILETLLGKTLNLSGSLVNHCRVLRDEIEQELGGALAGALKIFAKIRRSTRYEELTRIKEALTGIEKTLMSYEESHQEAIHNLDNYGENLKKGSVKNADEILRRLPQGMPERNYLSQRTRDRAEEYYLHRTQLL